MQIYHYHPQTRAYVGSSAADESPLEPGTFLLPAYAVAVPPPDFQPESETCLYDPISGWAVTTLSTPDPTPLPTEDEIKQTLVQAVQKHLDTTVKSRGYDGILSAASYSTSPHPTFGQEGIAARDWRDSVWLYCYQVLAECQAGTRAIPTPENLVSELPILTWP